MKKINIPLVLLMYAMIFNPPVLSFGWISENFPVKGLNWIWIVMPLSLIYLWMNRKHLKKYVNLKAVLITECVIAGMLVYCMLIAVINHNPVTAFGYMVYWMAGDIPFGLAVWVYLRKKGQGFEELLDHLLGAGLVMAATSVLAFIPAVKEFFVRIMEAYGIPYVRRLSLYRNYGLAANMTATASFVQAVLALTALYRAVKGRKIWYAFFPLLALSANLNTRASIIFILAGMAAILVSQLWSRNIKEAGKFLIVAAVSVGVAFGGKYLVQVINPQTSAWLAKGMSQMADFVSGAEIEEGYEGGYFGMLGEMSGWAVLPRGIHLVFGEGRGILWGHEEYGVHSDIGFVNDLWRGGILYSAAVIGLYILVLWKIMHSKTVSWQDGIFFSGFFLLVFLVNNVKGSFFIHSDVTAVIWMMIPALLWNRAEEAAPELPTKGIKAEGA